MKPKLTETQLLKYWIDSEFTILHIMFAIVMFFLTEGWVANILLTLYVIYSVIYLFSRIAVIAVNDPDFLKLPKK